MWGKKDKHCDPGDPADREQGSWWDHVLIDADSRLIVSLVIGRRTTETVNEAFTDFYRRTDGDLPPVISTDAYAAYQSVILDTYGVYLEDLGLTDEEKAELDWDNQPPFYFPVEINYATVHKYKEKGRVVRVEAEVVLGTEGQVAEALGRGSSAASVNTCYAERYHATQRHFNARKARKAYTFSKDVTFHVAVTWLCVTFYNFGWAPRTLRVKVQDEPPRYRYRTPAMVAGLADHPWTMAEILRYPLFPPARQPTAPQQRPYASAKSDGG